MKLTSDVPVAVSAHRAMPRVMVNPSFVQADHSRLSLRGTKLFVCEDVSCVTRMDVSQAVVR